MLHIDLSEEESNLLLNTINGFYGPDCRGSLTKNNFVNFIHRGIKLYFHLAILDFVVRSFASNNKTQGNETIAKATLMKIKSSNTGKGLDLNKLL